VFLNARNFGTQRTIAIGKGWPVRRPFSRSFTVRCFRNGLQTLKSTAQP
jgi:hypothetical protein